MSKTLGKGRKMELPLDEEDGTFTNISLADDSAEYRSRKLSAKVEGAPTTMMNADMDAVENQVELEEKTRLINQVLELQHTLEDTIGRNLRGNLHVHLMETGINQPEVLPSTRMKREENRKERPTCKPWPKLLPLPTT
ncbi:short coiled-coil protein isoform X7 [Parus major]|uniref:short coiled-coil protein isoform X7 n=1 Tax=Parus major TaxID=9157 RepID=UPI0014445461|nr:short coiled-coil protein isoform X7 [Parus major]